MQFHSLNCKFQILFSLQLKNITKWFYPFLLFIPSFRDIKGVFPFHMFPPPKPAWPAATDLPEEIALLARGHLSAAQAANHTVEIYIWGSRTEIVWVLWKGKRIDTHTHLQHIRVSLLYIIPYQFLLPCFRVFPDDFFLILSWYLPSNSFLVFFSPHYLIFPWLLYNPAKSFKQYKNCSVGIFRF